MCAMLVVCSGMLIPPRASTFRFDAVDPHILSLLRSGGLYTSLDDFSTAAEGLAVWRSALAAGRVPDFDGVDAADGRAPWPVQPLRGTLGDAMIELGMPSTTQRHPSLVPAALAAVLAAARRFDAASGPHETEAPQLEGAQGALPPRDDDSWLEEDAAAEAEAAVVAEAGEEAEAPSAAAAESAQRLAAELTKDWTPALSGVRAVEGLQSGGAAGGDGEWLARSCRGPSPCPSRSPQSQPHAYQPSQPWHLLARSALSAITLTCGAVGALTSAAGDGFSPHDGLWQHAGWAPPAGLIWAARAVEAKLVLTTPDRVGAPGALGSGWLGAEWRGAALHTQEGATVCGCPHCVAGAAAERADQVAPAG